MIAVTVAKALALLANEECVPRSADTAVVIRLYGPFTINPVKSSSTETQDIHMLILAKNIMKGSAMSYKIQWRKLQCKTEVEAP